MKLCGRFEVFFSSFVGWGGVGGGVALMDRVFVFLQIS